jgi:hypothetical protein
MFTIGEWQGFIFFLSSAEQTYSLLNTSYVIFQNSTNLHPVVELFGYIAWTWHGVLRLAYRIIVETFLHTGLLGVQLIWNVG